MSSYTVELVEETGRTLISGLEDDFAPIWEALQTFGDNSDFTKKALKEHIESQVSRSLGFTGFFGLTDELANPRCYIREEKGHLEVCFDSYRLTTWGESDSGPQVDVSLIVDPIKGGKILSDFILEDIPKGYISDLFGIYQMLQNPGFTTEPFVIEYVGGRTAPATKIIPSTKGIVALRMLKRVADLYSEAREEMNLIDYISTEKERRVGDDRFLQAKRGFYCSDLLKILGVEI